MKKIKIILVISVLLTVNCKAQREYFSKETDMKYFNKKNFKDWKIDNSVSTHNISYLEKGSNRVEIIEGDKTKQITLYEINSPYSYIYRYNAKTNILIQNSTFFYSMLIETTNTYDENGILIKQQNWDTLYKISIKELIKICKQRLNIDLLDLSLNLTVDRSSKFHPIYIIRIPYPNTRNTKARYVTIDADNGNILFEKEIYSKEELKEYLDNIYQTKVKNKYSSPSPYRTYNGKNYTEEEWKVFEEQQYQEYKKNKAKKSFWERLFGN